MNPKIVDRDINFGSRLESSPYRVKYGNPRDFDTLEVHCHYGQVEQIFVANASALPMEKDSIYFRAVQDGNSFKVNWRGGADSFMKRIK